MNALLLIQLALIMSISPNLACKSAAVYSLWTGHLSKHVIRCLSTASMQSIVCLGLWFPHGDHGVGAHLRGLLRIPAREARGVVSHLPPLYTFYTQFTG